MLWLELTYILHWHSCIGVYFSPQIVLHRSIRNWFSYSCLALGGIWLCMFHHFMLYRAVLFWAEYRSLELALRLFQPDIKLILFVCMVEQTLGIEWLNSFGSQCQQLPTSYHNTGRVCLKLFHSLDFIRLWLLALVLKLPLILMVWLKI